jgi:hypothetical protein
MRNLMRTLTLSAAALAALVSIAPKADAQNRGTGRGNESSRQESRAPREGVNRGHESRGQEFRGRERGEFRGRERGEFRGRGAEFRGRTFNGYRGRAFFPARSFGRGYVSPFRIFAGRRFYSYCPGPGYVYIANYGWAVPPFFGAEWIPAYTDEDGFQVEGWWR